MIDFTEIEFHKDDLEELMKLEIDFAFQPIFRAKDMSIGAYEALEYFKPQYAKLDRSLISNIHSDSDKQKQVADLMQEFHSRGMKVVAEGIETKEEFDYLRMYTDVDYFQGYYLGMPA